MMLSFSLWFGTPQPARPRLAWCMRTKLAARYSRLDNNKVRNYSIFHHLTPARGRYLHWFASQIVCDEVRLGGCDHLACHWSSCFNSDLLLAETFHLAWHSQNCNFEIKSLVKIDPQKNVAPWHHLRIQNMYMYWSRLFSLKLCEDCNGFLRLGQPST